MRQLKGLQFYRQRIIGDYIVDFHCPKANLIIELDGGQHYTEEGMAKDKKRDDFLQGIGFKVLRFSDSEALESLDSLLRKVYENL